MGGRGKNFYILRLKNTSLPELAYRTKQAVLLWWLKTVLKKRGSPIYVPVIAHLDVESLKMPSFHHQISTEVLEILLQGKRDYLNETKEEIENFEKQYRGTLFDDINVAKAPLDIRAVWEPSRLQHITLLLAFSFQNPTLYGSDQFLKLAKKTCLKWIDANNFLFGPHYISAMECGLRIPVFFYCLKCLDNLSSDEYRKILRTLYLHAWWVSKRLSLYSSLGNHTIAECVGLVFAGAFFRHTTTGKKWINRACALLKKEAYHQILNDGGPAEQSLNYHRFVLDLYGLAIDFLERNKLYDFNEIKPRLVEGENFLNAFQDQNGNMPSIGDSDDGYAIAPEIQPERPKPENPKNQYTTFPDSGYTVIRLANNSILTFDHGPLGMPPLFNHGHADALSITFFKNGKAMLVDTGTYRYNGEPAWRKYFKGTRAHNTVTIDGLDQAIQETSFIWSHPYKTKLVNCIKRPDGFLVKATHDGYSRLKWPVWHERSLFFCRETTFLLKDTFTGRGVHTFELNYHLHPDASLRKINEWWVIDNQGVKVYLRLLNGLDFILITGQENPILGWYSPAYGIKIKSGVLQCTTRSDVREAVFLTAICTDSPVEPNFLLEGLHQFENQTANS
jgi:hypothetical protein